MAVNSKSLVDGIQDGVAKPTRLLPRGLSCFEDNSRFKKEITGY